MLWCRQALIEWFPDRKGLASSLAIAGFGSGALVFAPLMNNMQVGPLLQRGRCPSPVSLSSRPFTHAPC